MDEDTFQRSDLFPGGLREFLQEGEFSRTEEFLNNNPRRSEHASFGFVSAAAAQRMDVERVDVNHAPDGAHLLSSFTCCPSTH